MGAKNERGVQAAGGVIVRHTPRGEIQVLLVHRPHREDWTFPKGKLEAGESHERCALREVEEETGLRCKLGAELPPSSYTNPKFPLPQAGKSAPPLSKLPIRVGMCSQDV
jgi:8-oxo-dGTP pyrophosphatase MutT (NUDIX family)